MSVPKIKFCGFTRAEDIVLAAGLGVDYVGLVFAARSPRRVTLEQARSLRAAVPTGIGVVALVMDTPADEVHAIAEALRPDVLQFHGGESDAFAAQFGLPYWKAVAMGGDPAAALARLGEHPRAQAFLFDGHAREVLAASELALVASGTATLETMLVGRPLVMAYRVAPLTYAIAKRPSPLPPIRTSSTTPPPGLGYGGPSTTISPSTWPPPDIF